MHNAAFQKLNIDACYVPLAPNISEVKNICDLIRTGVISGSNVTIPYKEEVMKYVDILSDEAKLIGSVNTLYSKDGKLMGHNTDAPVVVIPDTDSKKELIIILFSKIGTKLIES